MIAVIPDWDGPGTGFIIIEAVAYIDTIEILVEFPLPRGLKRRLRQMAGRRIRFRDATRPDAAAPNTRHAYGLIITIFQPTTSELRLILASCGRRYRVRRVDVACDFHTATTEEAASCGRYLDRHGWQKWRGRKRKRHDSENVRYWSVNAATTRNIALYSDKPSRKNGGPCAHWEMRFITADACRRAGLGDLRTLMKGVNALKLLSHQAGLRELSRGQFLKATEEAARHTKRKNGSLDKRTVPQIERRVKGLIFAALQTKSLAPEETSIHLVPAQDIHDRIPLLRKALVEAAKWQDLAPVIRWLR